MPGPKMGPRPKDFDEHVVRQSPTFRKWEGLQEGAKLRYACREFVKGRGDDEERLMRRIMIARRNNIRDHETLKRARQTARTPSGEQDPNDQAAPSEKKQRRTFPTLSDSQIAEDMDVAAVEATRSYRTWLKLAEGEEFVYNQKYMKGREGQDWLLRKNIWRRMRYRRENKKLVQRLYSWKGQPVSPTASISTTNSTTTKSTRDQKATPTKPISTSAAAAGIVDQALLSSAAAGAADTTVMAAANASFPKTATVVESAVVESALAAADSYVKSEHIAELRVHNPLEAAATTEALDAAAKLAAASASSMANDGEEDEGPEVLEEV